MRMVGLLLLLLPVLLPLSAGARAEDAAPYPAGVSEQVIDGRTVLLRIPPGPPPKQATWGLVLALGGKLEELAVLSEQEYVVCLVGPKDKGRGWTGSETKELWALVDLLAKKLPIDPKRMHGMAIDQGLGTIAAQVLLADGNRFVSATFFNSHYFGTGVAARAKKEVGVLAYRFDPQGGTGIDHIAQQITSKVRTVELRDDEKGIAGPYFPWWIRSMEGRFVPGEDVSFEWTADVKTHDGLKQLFAQKTKGAFVHVFAQEDATSPEAKALHLETFFDDRVRRFGRGLVAVKVDRAAQADLATALGVKVTPTVVVFKKDGTEAARFEGAIKTNALAKALESALKK
jgi:hypothetical protein